MIELIKNCCLARSKKVNEVIKRLNPLLDIKVITGLFDEADVSYSDNSVILFLPEGGGGDVSGFDEEVFKVVVPGNQVEERVFLTKSAPYGSI